MRYGNNVIECQMLLDDHEEEKEYTRQARIQRETEHDETFRKTSKKMG